MRTLIRALNPPLRGWRNDYSPDRSRAVDRIEDHGQAAKTPLLRARPLPREVDATWTQQAAQPPARESVRTPETPDIPRHRRHVLHWQRGQEVLASWTRTSSADSAASEPEGLRGTVRPCATRTEIV